MPWSIQELTLHVKTRDLLNYNINYNNPLAKLVRELKERRKKRCQGHYLAKGREKTAKMLEWKKELVQNLREQPGREIGKYETPKNKYGGPQWDICPRIHQPDEHHH